MCGVTLAVYLPRHAIINSKKKERLGQYSISWRDITTDVGMDIWYRDLVHFQIH